MIQSWINFTLEDQLTTLIEKREDRFSHLIHPTSTLNLIERVYREYPIFSKRIIRSRIYTSENHTRMLQDLIRVAAKRFSVCELPEVEIESVKVRGTELRPTEPRVLPVSRLSWAELKTDLLADLTKITHVNPKYSLHRNVGAALYTPSSHTIKIFRNQNQLVKTWHAEMLLLRAHNYTLPLDSILFTTLKPCRMCAAWILGSVDNTHSLPRSQNNFKVVYLQNDEGRLASNTALDEYPGIQVSWTKFRLENPEVSSLFSDAYGEPAQSTS